MNSDEECLLAQDDVEVPELCACCAKPGYVRWFCYHGFCSGFAMNSLSKLMGEGRKLHYIIVFLLILGLGLISSILQGVLEIHLTEAARAATGYFPDISDADRHLVIALQVIGLFSMIFAVMMFILMCNQRRRFVRKHEITESNCETCCLIYWCSPCAYAQMGSTHHV